MTQKIIYGFIYGLEKIDRFFMIRNWINTDRYNNMAENGGFEPPEACTSIDFKSTAIDHSANSPFFIFNLRNYITNLKIFGKKKIFMGDF